MFDKTYSCPICGNTARFLADYAVVVVVRIDNQGRFAGFTNSLEDELVLVEEQIEESNPIYDFVSCDKCGASVKAVSK
jgi:hypothetical protein